MLYWPTTREVAIRAKDGRMYEWAAPIPYNSVVFDGWGGWPNVGTFYHDASARKNHGTLVNSPTWQWVPELGRWGVLFNGSTQYATAVPVAYTTNAFTLATWVSFSGIGVQQTLARAAGHYALQTGGASSVNKLDYFHNIGGSIRQYGWFLEITANVWYHVAVTVRSQNVGGDGAMRAYVNGVAVTPATAYAGDVSVYSPEFIAVNNGSQFFVNGNMSGVVTCNTALSPSQIQWLANRANNPWQQWKRRIWAVSAAAPAIATRNIIIGGGVI